MSTEQAEHLRGGARSEAVKPVPRQAAPDRELELLLQLSRVHLTSERMARVRAICAEGIHAERLVELAHRHGLLPLVHQHLGAEDLLPPALVERLRALARDSAMLNLALYAELVAILAVLEAESIPVIPYKGPALALRCYGNIGLREFRDLDLLVHREHVPRIKALLAERGYRPEYALSGATERIHLRESCDYQFGKQRGRGMVEVHWALMPHYLSAPLESGFWARAVPRPFGNRMALTPAVEDLVLFLCAHAAKHAWERLTWLTDVAECIRTEPNLDWDVLRRRARELRAERVLHLGLSLAHRLLDVALPETVLEDLAADRALPALEREVARGWSSERPRRALATSAFHLATRDDLGSRLRYVTRRALNLNPNDWSFVALPEALAGLYYPLRLVRLGMEGAARLRRLAPGS